MFFVRTLKSLLRIVSLKLYRSLGWRFNGHLPEIPQFLIIGYPHASNWDFLLFLLFRQMFGIHIRFFAKDSMFSFPAKYLFRWLGGIPIDRRQNKGIVHSSVNAFRNTPRFVLGMMPEGTRSGGKREWRSGFYHIANEAGVPIVLCLIDYGNKNVTICPPLMPTGDYQRDLQALQEYLPAPKPSVTACDPISITEL